MHSQASPLNVPNLQSAYQQHLKASINPATSAPLYVQPVSIPGASFGADSFAKMMSSASSYGLNQAMPYALAKIFRPGACDLGLVAKAGAGECTSSCRYSALFRLWYSKIVVLI